MKLAKRQKLEAAGWRVGSADEFLATADLKQFHYMNVTSPVDAIVRVPYPMPRWRAILKALTPVMHSYGYRQKDVYSLDGLLPYPDMPWDEEEQTFAKRLAQAYAGDPRVVPDFDLYDWQDGQFALVRKAAS